MRNEASTIKQLNKQNYVPMWLKKYLDIVKNNHIDSIKPPQTIVKLCAYVVKKIFRYCKKITT